MPYPVPIGSILEVAIEGELFGQQIMTLFHYILESGTIGDGRQLALDALAALQAPGGLWTDYLLCVSQDMVNISMSAQWIAPTRYAYVTSAVGAATGGLAQASLPPNVSVALTKTCNNAGRHYVGTIHMPAVAKTSQDEGVIDAGAVVVYTQLAEDVPESIVLGGGTELTPAIYNRAAYALSPIITACQVQNTLRTMHRRTVGLGS